MANTVNIIDRRIKLEGIHNIRDLGGLRTEDGAVIRRNCLLRSGQLGKATPADREYLRTKHRLSAVIDLRTPRERDQMPERDLQGIELLEIPVFEDIRTGLSHESSADAQMTTEEFLGSMPSLSVMYVNIGRQELCRERIGMSLRKIMEHDYESGSVLWHCTEGKDRCGILSALVLTVLGVPRDLIIEDYLMTNEVNGPKSEQIYQSLLSRGKSKKIAAGIREIFLAKEEYLGAFLQMLDEEFDRPHEFATKGLGIPQKTVDRFREAVLE